MARGSETRTSGIVIPLLIPDSNQRQGGIKKQEMRKSQTTHLLGLEVALLDFAVQVLERAAVLDLERVDDVAERLGHLPALLVAHHGVQVH